MPRATPTAVPVTPARPVAARACRVMVATDLGQRDAEVLQVALARAGAAGHVALCHVVDADVDVAPLYADVHAQLTADLGDRSRGVDVFIRAGDQAEQILAAAAAWDPDLLILGRPQQPAGVLRRIFSPGTVERVMRGTPCPLLLSGNSPGTGRALVGVETIDGELEAMLARVRAEPHPSARRLVIAHCRTPMAAVSGLSGEAFPFPSTLDSEIEQTILHRLRDAVRTAGLRAEVQVINGPPVDGLLRLAQELAVDELIVGSHGRSGLARLLIGSISEKIASDAPCPVLIIPLDAGAATAS